MIICTIKPYTDLNAPFKTTKAWNVIRDCIFGEIIIHTQSTVDLIKKCKWNVSGYPSDSSALMSSD